MDSHTRKLANAISSPVLMSVIHERITREQEEELMQHSASSLASLDSGRSRSRDTHNTTRGGYSHGYGHGRAIESLENSRYDPCTSIYGPPESSTGLPNDHKVRTSRSGFMPRNPLARPPSQRGSRGAKRR
ncbi:hypothetical protein BGX31_003031, partial [Mortierella sp. GBA43]